MTALEAEARFFSTAVAASFGVAVVSISATIGSAVVAFVAAASSAAAGAGAAGGTVGSAASGAGGGAAGGVTDVAAVLLAVQRLSVLASMPVEKSELHVSVGETLAWTKGSLGLFPWISQTWDRAGRRDFKDPVERLRRLDFESKAEVGRRGVADGGNTKEEWVNALEQLVDTFTTLGCALAAVLLLQLLVHLLWKHCINRKYYAQTQKASPTNLGFLVGPVLAPAPSALSSGPPFTLRQTAQAARGRCSLFVLSILPTRARKSNDCKKKVKFYPFPAILRWPTLPCFVCVCCLSGLLHGAIRILMARKAASLHALAFAIAAVAIALGVLLLLWVQLILFACRHLRHMWVPETPAAAPNEVADPALRIIGTARRRVLTLSSSLSSRAAQHDAGAAAARQVRWEQRRTSRLSISQRSSTFSLKAAISRRSLIRIEQRPFLHRARGAFLAQGSRQHESKEPARTERLLANPFALFPPTGQDAFESIAVTNLLGRRYIRR